MARARLGVAFFERGRVYEDRRRPTHPIQFAKEFLFEGEIFRDRFDDELYVSQPVELNHWMDEPQHRPGLTVGESATLHGFPQTTADLAERLR